MNYPIPARQTNFYDLENDEFGYSVYSLVVFATPEQQAAVQEIRDKVKVRRSMLPAHVTVKGPFSDISSIADVQSLIDKSLIGLNGVSVDFSGSQFKLRPNPNEFVAGLSVEVSPELAELHRRLLASIDPISTNSYPPEKKGEFPPHLTVFHEPASELESLGEQLLDDLDIGTGFPANTISLMGHVGTPFRGEWVHISEHPLA